MFNKIENPFNIQRITVSIFFTCISYSVNAQGLKIIKNYAGYLQTVEEDSLNKMIELKTLLPDIQYDLRYATTNNFLHKKLYKTGKITFLRLPVAKALAEVEHELNEKGFSLKIWDAYRPYKATVAMWEPIKDDRYVADPKFGSGHNRGMAVDLTIIDKATGKELNMGTDFDNFSDTAHSDFKNLSDDILRNRLLLKTLMEKYGFKALQTEWWHFFWTKENFDLMDIDPKEFKND